jgi:hypothetical protein
MEHRELPRIASGDRPARGALQETAGRFRLRRFDPDRDPRELDFGRAGLLTLVFVAGTAVLLYVAFTANRIAVGWLHHQPQYQFSFSHLRLVPEPPSWYRGGSQEFLKRVHSGAGEPERFSTLEVTPERIALAFKNYPWVEDVRKVTYAPGRICVELRYRQPVGWVDLRNGKQQIVDDKGIILAVEDVDVDQLGQVPKISGDGLSPPSDPRAGVVWKSIAAPTDVAEAEPRILAAARLAGFLRAENRAQDAASSPALRVLEIIVTERASPGLFLINAEGAAIWWGRAPGDEGPGALSADQKWAMLVNWQRSTRSRVLKEGDYWAFSKKGVYHVCPSAHPPHEPSDDSDAGKQEQKGGRKPAGSG